MNDGKTLYWQALTGRTLYAIDTAKLRPDVSEDDRAAAVHKVATTNVADGLWMSRKGVLYITAPGDNAINRLSGDHTETVLDRCAAALAGHDVRRAGWADLRHRQPYPGHQLVHPRRPGFDQDRAVLFPGSACAVTGQAVSFCRSSAMRNRVASSARRYGLLSTSMPGAGGPLATRSSM